MLILAPIDFSPVTARQLAVAEREARAHGARLLLLHVAAPEPDFVPYSAGPETVREQVAEELREEHRGIQALAAELAERGVEAEARMVQGPTVEVIVGQAAERGADLVVLGTHGHSLAHRLLLGSISEGVLRKAPCPVLFVPAAEA